jgi:hypothetical protein
MNPQFNNWQSNSINTGNMQFYHPQKEPLVFNSPLYTNNGLNVPSYAPGSNSNFNNKTIMTKSNVIDPIKAGNNNTSTFFKPNNEYNAQYSPNVNKYPPVNSVSTNAGTFNSLRNTYN